MAQKGLSARQRDFSEVDALIGRMAKDGVKTAGKAFVGTSPTQIKVPKATASTLTKEVLLNPVQPEKQDIRRWLSPAYGLAKTFSESSIGKEVIGGVKKSAKNAYGLVRYAIPKGFTEPWRQVSFAATHGGQQEDTFYGNQYKTLVSQKAGVQKQLNDNLSSGVISKSEYDSALQNLSSEYDNKINEAAKKVEEVRARIYGIENFQTGEYQNETSSQDVFNAIDGGMTVIDIASLGRVRGATMAMANQGALKTAKNSVLGSITKLAGQETSERIATKAAASSAAKVAKKIDDIIAGTIETIPGFKEYSERQIAKLGADITAKQFVKNAVSAVVINAPLRQMNIDSARTIVNTVMDGSFLETPEGKSWISSGAGQSLLMAGMLLEGGPIGFTLKYGKKLAAAGKVAMFGDDAVKVFDQLSPKAMSEIKDPKVIEKLTKSMTGAEGTKLDHFARILSGDDNALTFYKALAKRPKEEIESFLSAAATWTRSGVSDSIYQVAAANTVKDLLAKNLTVNADNALDQIFRWQKAGELGEQISEYMVSKGVLKPGQKVAVVTFSRQAQQKVVDDVEAILKDISDQSSQFGDVPRETILLAQKDAALSYIEEQAKAGVPWAQHGGLVKDMVDAIADAERAFPVKGHSKSIVQALKVKDTAVAIKGAPKRLTRQLNELGYYGAIPENVGNPFISVAEAKRRGIKLESTLVGPPKNGKGRVNGATRDAKLEDIDAVLGDEAVRLRGSSPGIGMVGALLNRMGIGLGDSHKMAYEAISTNAANIINKQTGLDGFDTLHKLQQYVDATNTDGRWLERKWRGTVTDLRQLTKNEISKALKIGDDKALEIKRALIQSHLDVKLHVRGLSDKLVDAAMKYNPAQALYSRIQGAFRYAWNPFFRTQEITETTLLAALNGKQYTDDLMDIVGLMNPKNKSYLDDIVKKMDSQGVLEATQYGEAATTGVLGKVTANILPVQKRRLAWVVDTMAQKYGMTVDDLLAKNTDEVLEVIRPIVQYPSKGLINSNFARTVNLAAFPSRYNVKVTGMALDFLSKQKPTVQAAVINGLMDFGPWLNSPEGLAWRQDYADEIAFLKWLTPVGNLDWTMRTLQGKNSSWSDFGQLGGLPFGLWTQILQSQGVINLQSPYIDPKSGEIYDKRIPDSVKGRVAMAIMDMLGSTFTYPGRTLQLPGKGQILRNVAYRATGATGQDFVYEKQSPDELSPDRQRSQQYWYERAQAAGRTDTKPAIPVSPKINIKQESPSGVPVRKYSKSQKYAASQLSKKRRTRKSKQPVPFNQLVGM